MATEYRVRWRREGRRLSTQIYQGWDDAYKKVMRIKALEAIKNESKYADMPPLVEQPTIETREVGAWAEYGWQPGEVRESEIESARHWAGVPAESEPWEPAF